MINMAHAASSSISHQSQPPLNLLSGFFPQSINDMPQTSNRPSDHKLNCTQGSSNLHNTASNNQNIFEAPLKPNIAPTPTNAAYDPNLSEMTKTISQSEEAGTLNRLSGTNFKPEHQTHRKDSIGPDSDSGSVGDDKLKAATKISINEIQLPTADKMVNNVSNTPFAGQIGMNPACYTNPTVPVTPDQQMYASQMPNGSCSMPLSYGPGFLNTMNGLGYSGYHPFQNRYSYSFLWSQGQPGGRKGRQTYAKWQTGVLEAEYLKNRYILRKRRLELATVLRLDEKQIKIWFQNRRMKGKKLKEPQAATSTTNNAEESTKIAGSTGNTSQTSECSSSTAAQPVEDVNETKFQHQPQQQALSAERVSDVPHESQSAYMKGFPNAQYQADPLKINNYHQMQDGIQPQTYMDGVSSAFSANVAQQYPCPSDSGSSVSCGQGPMDPASIATSAAAVHPIYNNTTSCYTQYQQYPLKQAAPMLQQQQQIQTQCNDYHTNYLSTQLQQQQMLHQQYQQQQHSRMQQLAMHHNYLTNNYGFNNPDFSAQSHMPHN